MLCSLKLRHCRCGLVYETRRLRVHMLSGASEAGTCWSQNFKCSECTI